MEEQKKPVHVSVVEKLVHNPYSNLRARTC